MEDSARKAARFSQQLLPAVEVPRPATPKEGSPVAFPCADGPVSPGSSSSSPKNSSKRAQRDQCINRDALTLALLFNGKEGPSLQNVDHTSPPAFFPNQRVSFSPRLRVSNKSGLLLAGRPGEATHDKEHVCSMLLGVTGAVEILDRDGSVKSKRIVADFCTDLSTGIKVWRRDAAKCLDRRRRAVGQPPREPEPDGSGFLPAGTYLLPLSMRIPDCDKLPPSFESRHYRLRYSMSLVILSRKANESLETLPSVVKLATVPFHVLPSTLPSLPPSLPTLTHEERRSLGSSIMSGLRSLAMSSSASNDALPPPSSHIVSPSLPCAHFSPGSVIPLTLRVCSRPLLPNSDLFLRVSLVRKIFVREASGSIEEDNDLCLPANMLWDPYCRSEETLASRWTYVPSEMRLGARSQSDKPTSSELILRDITLPVGSGVDGWTHGYSGNLDLAPGPRQSVDFAKGSFFAPVVQEAATEHARDSERHTHVSTRFFVAVEVGFHQATPAAPERLADILAERQAADHSVVVPSAGSFSPVTYGVCDPFAMSEHSPSMPRSRSQSSWTSNASAVSSLFGKGSTSSHFPGTMRTLSLPIVLGSVAEPTMQCISGGSFADAAIDGSRRAHPADREEIAETANERRERIGDDGEEPWLVAPPSYSNSLRTAPAYV